MASGLTVSVYAALGTFTVSQPNFSNGCFGDSLKSPAINSDLLNLLVSFEERAE
jgi:hypothetical protein